MTKRKYKISNEKIANSKVMTRSIAKNEKIKNIAMTKKQKSQQKQKFEQTNDQTNQQHKKTISNDIDNNTIKKNFLRICRINNFVNYLARDSIFHLLRFALNISILVDILFAYEQLSHAQFRRTFVQFSLIEIIENVNRSDKNEQL